MRDSPGAWRLLAAVGCAALLAVGCAAATSSLGGPAAVVTTSGPAARPASAGSAAGTPRQQAEADAAAIVSAFVPPPGAQRLTVAPRLPGGWQQLDGPSSTIVGVAVADKSAWWLVPGQPRQVLAWEVAHLPGRFTPGDTSGGDSHWDEMFSLPAVPGVLLDRELVVGVSDAGGGRTAVRVDGEVEWQPPRLPDEIVPATARVVTLSQVPQGDPHPAIPVPVTITGPSAVRRIAALVNALHVSASGGVGSCPATLSNLLVLTFRSTASGPALATVEGPGSCDLILYLVHGRQLPALQDTTSFIPAVLAAASLHWQLAGP